MDDKYAEMTLGELYHRANNGEVGAQEAVTEMKQEWQKSKEVLDTQRERHLQELREIQRANEAAARARERREKAMIAMTAVACVAAVIAVVVAILSA